MLIKIEKNVKYEFLSFNIFRKSFKLKNNYFNVIFFPWCFDVIFKFHNSVLIEMLISLQLYKTTA